VGGELVDLWHHSVLRTVTAVGGDSGAVESLDPRFAFF
jgi:hypothetical protein